MPWYRCSICGENFPLKLYDTPGLVGFFTTRWVEAADPQSAELACVKLLKGDPSFQCARTPGVSPMIYVDGIDELAAKPETHPGAGFTFFPMDAA